MNRTEELLATYRGLVNTVCRPDHMTYFQISPRVAAAAVLHEGLTARGRAARIFTAVAEVLRSEGYILDEDVAEYQTAAGEWAFDYEEPAVIPILMAYG